MQAESYISKTGLYGWVMNQGRPAHAKRPELGERIAQARQQAGLTQKQLAERLGVTQRVVTYWEREAVGLRADQLSNLAEALEVSSDYFLGRENKRRGNGPAGRARQTFEKVSRQTRTQQKKILDVVDALLAQQG